jgi:hypothetical protein
MQPTTSSPHERHPGLDPGSTFFWTPLPTHRCPQARTGLEKGGAGGGSNTPPEADKADKADSPPMARASFASFAPRGHAKEAPPPALPHRHPGLDPGSTFFWTPLPPHRRRQVRAGLRKGGAGGGFNPLRATGRDTDGTCKLRKLCRSMRRKTHPQPLPLPHERALSNSEQREGSHVFASDERHPGLDPGSTFFWTPLPPHRRRQVRAGLRKGGAGGGFNPLRTAAKNTNGTCKLRRLPTRPHPESPLPFTWRSAAESRRSG